MNRTPEEKLSDYLADIDQGLLDEAMAVDSAEKLQKARKILPFSQKSLLRLAVAAMICVILLASILPILRSPAPPAGAGQLDVPPSLMEPTWGTRPTDPTTPLDSTIPSIPIESLDPPWEIVGTNVSIDSADMLNYYSALYLLSQQHQTSLTAAGSSSGYSLTLLDELDIPIDETYPQFPADDLPLPETEPSEWGSGYDTDNTEPPDTTEGPPIAPSTQPTEPKDEFYYYDIDPSAQFHLSKVLFFRIYLSGDGYLTQKIGSGVVDVVITDFDIFGDYLITFKNGNSYYSCLTDGKSPTEYRFTAHKYIQGFQVVKNLALQDHRFNVQFDENGQATYFSCNYFEEGECPVLGKTYIAEVSENLTLAELEEYFRSVKIHQ